MLKRLLLVWAVTLLALWNVCPFIPSVGFLFRPRLLLAAQYVPTAFTPTASIAAPTLNKTTCGSGTTTSGVFTLSVPSEPGKFNFVAFVYSTTVATATSITDSSGSNTYVSLPSLSPSVNCQYSGHQCGWDYSAGGATGVTSVSLNLTGSANGTYVEMCFSNYSGVASSSPLDTSTTSAANNTTWVTNSITTTNSSDLLVGGAAAGGYVVTFTVTSPFVLEGQGHSADSSLVTFDRIVSATGTYSAGGGGNSGDTVTSALAAFKAGS